MKIIPTIVLAFISFLGFSQDFRYQVLFEGIGDNREFTNEFGYPQTILGTRGAFEIGVDFDHHQLRGGLSQFFEFGSDIDAQKPKLTMYYQFNNEQIEFLFGAFPRKGKIGFPLVMLTDTLLYYRPNIEGMYGAFNWNWGKQNAFVDWMSRRTETQPEIFTAGSSGEISFDNFFLENYFLLTHNFRPLQNNPGETTKDYLGFAIQAGVRTGKNQDFTGHLKAGILASSFRERGITDGFQNATSFFAEAFGKFKNFGIKSVLNSGSGHQFAYGDMFYRADNYLRTDVIWYFFNHEKVKGKFNLSLHVIDWKELNNQQQLSVIYIFGK